MLRSVKYIFNVLYSIFINYNKMTLNSITKFCILSTEALILECNCLRDKYHVLPIGHSVNVIALLEISISFYPSSILPRTRRRVSIFSLFLFFLSSFFLPFSKSRTPLKARLKLILVSFFNEKRITIHRDTW